MRAGKLVLLTVALAIALPATASAATFTVNENGDQPDASTADGACDRSVDFDGNQCTLRAAIEQANETASNDTIKFSSLFDGTFTMNTISLTSDLPSIDNEVTINGGNCAPSGTAKPCVGIVGNGNNAIVVSGGVDGVDVRGLAISDAFFAIDLADEDATVKGSWVGIDLDENVDGNTFGINIAGDRNFIGGTTGADRNVIGGNNQGVRIDGNDNRVRGNYIGVGPDGTTPAPNDAVALFGSGSGNVIGASISSAGRATAKCDKGCNVISNGTGDGLNVGNNFEDTTIKGNFIGLDATGGGAAENAVNGIFVAGDAVTIGGDTSAERNFITGGDRGIFTGTLAGLVVKRNFIGLNSTGSATLALPNFGGMATFSSPADPALISRNRIMSAGTGLDEAGEGARIVRNKFGIGKNGESLAGQSTGIRIPGESATVGEPGAGNTIGNTGACCAAILIDGLAGAGSGDNNIVQGNYVGRDSNGTAYPNGGVGIRLLRNLGDVDFNKIGGTSSDSENVISNSLDDAIRLQDATGDSNGNQFKRNRGKDNGTDLTGCSGAPCDLFLDLQGNDGFTNGGSGLQNFVEAPTISGANRTSIDGINGDASATVYIFRTSDPGGSAPTRVNAFVDTAVVDGDGEWSATFPKIPAGQNLTVLMITPSPDLNGSELSEVCTVAGEDC